MPKILSSIACNLDVNILAASFPLLEASRVEAIEWSFDALFKVKDVPVWFTELLDAFSTQKRLIGHGVFFSLFSGRWSNAQSEWLKELRKVCATYNFDHITEHFGFMTGKDFHSGAPLNIPYSPVTLALGRDRLKRIYDACRCPVGLENLAFSYSLDEVKRHGEFLEKLVDAVNGFIILDLHNLYCQIKNFSIPFNQIIQLYPLEIVREIHVSGGSWDESDTDPGRKIRRDTHDDAVPEDVFELLSEVIEKCPNLKYVVLEQLGNGLTSAESKKIFCNDFLQMKNIVSEKNKKNRLLPEHDFLPLALLLDQEIVENEALHAQQSALSAILESSDSCSQAIHLLKNSSLSNTDWQIERWQPYMIETARKIARKWK